MMASHSRKDEYEADDLGVQLSAKSGYQPDALGDILSTLNKSIEIFTGEKEKSSYFNDHPYTPDRVSRIKKGICKFNSDPINQNLQYKKRFLKGPGWSNRW
ncbi:MAG: M48 family metalloprotease [Flammeovirgaceae bacterium]|nr:M48 family metalloprotease [Flammeovirgaceae bacterium]